MGQRVTERGLALSSQHSPEGLDSDLNGLVKAKSACSELLVAISFVVLSGLGERKHIAGAPLLQTHTHTKPLLLLSRFSRVQLCDPIDGSPPGSPFPGILQARTLEWVAISFSNKPLGIYK